MLINIFLWIIFGLFAGFATAYGIHKSTDRAAHYIILGIVGALVGGTLGTFAASQTPEAFSPAGLAFAAISALGLLGLYKNISPLT